MPRIERTVLGRLGDQAIEVPAGGEPLAGLFAALCLPEMPGPWSLGGRVDLAWQSTEFLQFLTVTLPLATIQRLNGITGVEFHADEGPGPEADPFFDHLAR